MSDSFGIWAGYSNDEAQGNMILMRIQPGSLDREYMTTTNVNKTELMNAFMVSWLYGSHRAISFLLVFLPWQSSGIYMSTGEAVREFAELRNCYGTGIKGLKYMSMSGIFVHNRSDQQCPGCHKEI